MSNIEALTSAENDLLTYLFWKHRNDCYFKMGTELQDSISYRHAKDDLAILSEIERKLEAIT